MSDLTTRILHALARPSYTPVKPKVLAKRMGLTDADYPEFRRTLRELVRDGRVAVGRNSTLTAADPYGSVTGVYRRTNSGLGLVRPHAPSETTGAEVRIREGREKDASTGDEVLVRITRRASKTGGAVGEVVRVLARATRTFVGTYFERDGEGLVRVDGTVFAHSVAVGDPGAKGVRPQDKVVIDLLRFPTADDRGEGVIVEVLGPLGRPGVDTLSIIRAFGLPEEFPAAAMEEARAQADKFNEADLDGRTDFTNDLVVTIDPADARDFDDAVSVEIDPKTKHWILTVHIADVGHFCKQGGPLDAEARARATSVYLPQKVIPMFPEVISNGLASLQEGRLRYVLSVRMEFTPGLQKGHVEFFRGAIRPRKRFTYEQVQAAFDDLDSPARRASEGLPDTRACASGWSVTPDILAMLKRMRDLALLLRKKRLKRGALELTMPEAVLEYDADGKVSGAHFAAHDLSHQVIEEFMLAANEAVAEHLARLGIAFLRRVHPAPNPEKLQQFAEFAGILGYKVRHPDDRFELQKLLHDTAEKPERAAIHYALLRSLKQATYSPIQDQHYALASQEYCHFTSPIRRYPDLVVHRLLDKLIRTGKASADVAELTVLGEHCSKMERRSETAERELVKLKLLQYLSTRIGEQLDAVITGVADYGFFAQAERFPAEGLVHISSLTDDYYHFDEASHTLTGGRSKKRFRLGDRVKVVVARVDLQRRMLDFRLAGDSTGGEPRRSPPPSGRRFGKRRR
ncbi:MAG: ribonuclease R [Gemmataceae bacterium]